MGSRTKRCANLAEANSKLKEELGISNRGAYVGFTEDSQLQAALMPSGDCDNRLYPLPVLPSTD